MPFKNSILFRLFGGESEESKKEKDPEEKLLDGGEDPEPEEQAYKPAPLDTALLQLPPEHSINRLWGLRMEQAGWLSAPVLRLGLPPGQTQPLSDGELEKELPRLRLAVTSASNQRVAKAVPKHEDDPQPNMDALVTVFLTQGQMTAWVLVFPPVGSGRELDRELLSAALRENQVTYGLEEETIAAMPESRDRYFHLFLIAKGVPPVHGQDGGVIDRFSREIKREITVDEFDRVDYTSLNLVQNVEAGEVICEIVPSLSGKPGTTVQGKEVPAKNGKPAVPPKGRNTELNEDGTALIATLSGHVEFKNRAFQVKPVLDIPGSVDFSTGNINFFGDVHIHGDVCSGFAVRAIGNVMVDGIVEAATVEAGGDLVVAKGVVGNGQATITVQRNLFVKYMENCCIRVRENLQTDCLVNCDVYCNGVVQARSGRGTIMGGRIWAAHEVSASIVGSKSECVTNILLGGLPYEHAERESIYAELQELYEETERTELQPESPARTSRLSTLERKQSVCNLRLERLEKDMAILSEQAQGEEEGAYRLSGGIVYPGTVISIGESMLRVHYETRQCIATLVGGEICLM